MPLVPETQINKAIQSHPFLSVLPELAQELGVRIYLVGGAVRDALQTGSFSEDLDVMVLDKPSIELANLVAERWNGRYVLLDEAFGIHRVVMLDAETEDPAKADHPPTVFDFSDALNNSLEDDLARRDLTINAMAIDLQTRQLIDRFNGLDDLKSATIRMVSEFNLTDDPLRMLRVFRFAAKLTQNDENPAKIDSDTLAVVRTHGEKILNSAFERIQVEFLKLLSAKRCFPTLLQMAESGLLEVILPELKPTRKVPPNGHHHLWLFEHTLELVNQAELLLSRLTPGIQKHLNESVNGVVTRMGLVKLACLLHDIGKPATWEIREDGRHTFYGHDKVSEDMTEEIRIRWKLSHELTRIVKHTVRWHLYPCQFGPDSPRKSVLRFFRRMGTETPDVVLLALADRLSTRGEDITEADLEKSIHDHLWLLDQYQQEQATLSLPRLVDGRQIMEWLAISPGPKIGEILEATQEAYQLGEIQTIEEAREWVLHHYGKISPV